MSGQMTELEAVNEVLTAVGDSPVQSLQAGTYIEAVRIHQILKMVSRNIQSIGWWFNEEENVLLQPDTVGNIKLANNIINITTVDDRDGSIIQRGNKVYNRKDRTYLFTKPIKVNMFTFLEWNELPQVAREYITAVATDKYNSGSRGLGDIKGDIQSNVADKYIIMKVEDTRARDINLLNNSRVYNIAFKNRR